MPKLIQPLVHIDPSILHKGTNNNQKQIHKIDKASKNSSI